MLLPPGVAEAEMASVSCLQPLCIPLLRPHMLDAPVSFGGSRCRIRSCKVPVAPFMLWLRPCFR